MSEWFTLGEPNADWEGDRQTILLPPIALHWSPEIGRTQGLGERCSRPFLLVGPVVCLAGHRKCHQHPERWLSENIHRSQRWNKVLNGKKMIQSQGVGEDVGADVAPKKLKTGDLDVPSVFPQTLPATPVMFGQGRKIGTPCSSRLRCWPETRVCSCHDRFGKKHNVVS